MNQIGVFYRFYCEKKFGPIIKRLFLIEFGLTWKLLGAAGILTLIIHINRADLPINYEPCKQHKVT